MTSSSFTAQILNSLSLFSLLTSSLCLTIPLFHTLAPPATLHYSMPISLKMLCQVWIDSIIMLASVFKVDATVIYGVWQALLHTSPLWQISLSIFSSWRTHCSNGKRWKAFHNNDRQCHMQAEPSGHNLLLNRSWTKHNSQILLESPTHTLPSQF